MQQLGRVVLLVLLALPAVAAVPTFTDPLTFTNPYQPFPLGGVKVFHGRKDGRPSVLVDLYLTTTRTFRVGAADVAAHVLQETEFSNGAVVEISQNFLAQADDGTPGTRRRPPSSCRRSHRSGAPSSPRISSPLVDETDEVKAIGLTVGTPAGRFGRSIRVVETTRLGDRPETKWYGAGVGVLRGKTKGETFALVASTLRPQ